MFSFKAYFWNNEVYINEQYKYAANEILTAYLNTDYYKRIDEEDLVYVLKTLKRSLLLTEDMEQANYEDYPSIVSSARAWLDEINEWLMQIPPYDKILEDRIYTLDSLLNGYRFFFDDGREIYEKDDKITWETITPNGCGDQTETGHFYIKLHKFVPKVLDDYQYYDEDMLYDLNEMNQKITEFFDNYISFIKSYVTVFETIMPFVDNYLHRESCFLSDNDIAKIFKEFQQKHIKNFLGIKCKMNSFGYKALKNQNNKPILCEEIRFADLESFLFYDFFNGIKKNYIPNKCKHCGKYFLIKGGKYFSYCDRPLKKEPDKTCRDVGSRRRYDDKCKNDPVWQTYNRAYKAHYARYMKKKMTTPQFEEWSRFASELRDKALAEQIKFEDYYEQIRK